LRNRAQTTSQFVHLLVPQLRVQKGQVQWLHDRSQLCNKGRSFVFFSRSLLQQRKGGQANSRLVRHDPTGRALWSAFNPDNLARRPFTHSLLAPSPASGPLNHRRDETRSSPPERLTATGSPHGRADPSSARLGATYPGRWDNCHRRG
jgi:hypothetical protein